MDQNCSILISHSIGNYVNKIVISAGTDFHLTEATSQQAEEDGEESEGRFKRGLMNNRRWAEQNSV